MLLEQEIENRISSSFFDLSTNKPALGMTKNPLYLLIQTWRCCSTGGVGYPVANISTLNSGLNENLPYTFSRSKDKS